MDTEARIGLFQAELNTIESERYRNFAKLALSKLPDYFFNIAASSTGKYHPRYAQGEGGLVRHTKAALHFCNELLKLEMFNKQESTDSNNFMSFNAPQRDLMRVGLLLHDGKKLGEGVSSYTVFNHPMLCANWLYITPEFREYLNKSELAFLHSVISSHMGEWNTDPRGRHEALPKPESAAQKFVHMCDYLASRKGVELLFSGNSIDINAGSVIGTEPKSNTAKPTSLADTPLTFGKYRDHTVGEVLSLPDGRNYLEWCLENATRISDESKELLRRALTEL